ncbi:MAG: class I tRNA ligase family protein, partial [Dehalococcoidales bacterium]
IKEVSASYKKYDHLAVKNRIEGYFCNTVADNYLEMVKSRLYDRPEGSMEKESARYTIYRVLQTVIKLLAPMMPYITEEIYQVLLKKHEGMNSVHLSGWPVGNPELEDGYASTIGKSLVEIATLVRRYKSEKRLPMSAQLQSITITVSSEKLLENLKDCLIDIKSVTRVDTIELVLAEKKGTRDEEMPDVQVRVE